MDKSNSKKPGAPACAWFKKGIGTKIQNLCEKFNDQKTMKQDGTQSYGFYRRKVNSKAFAIPILTAITMIKADAVRIGIANALELTLLL